MTIKDDLTKKYHRKSLKEIETSAIGNRDKSLEHRRDFILSMYYLKFTGRFREDLTYKKETFESYINERFNLRIGTYDQECWAFIKYEDASKKHGTGLINKIKKMCGPGNVVKVIAAIDSAEKNSKFPLSMSKKKKIILKSAKPRKAKPDSIPKSFLESEIVELKQTIHQNRKSDIGKDDQIKKLKNTVVKLKAKNIELRALVDKYRAKEAEFINYMKPIIVTEQSAAV